MREHAAKLGVRTSGPMERLPFALHQWTRRIWTSEKAQRTWEPRLAAVSDAWAEVEVRLVLRGDRPSALTHMSARALAEWSGRLPAGIVQLPLVEVSAGAAYQAVSVPVREGEPTVWRVVTTRAELEPEWHRVFQQDDAAMGRLLGYPECCVAAFGETWVRDGCIDTTWGAYARSRYSAEGPYEANILARWLGVRLISHLPCSFTCAETVRQGRQFLAAMRAEGFAEEAGWLQEILTWPMEWSAVHGIAEIKYPVLKVSTNTDATGEKYVVRREGGEAPAETPRGSSFPYTARPGRKLTDGTSHAKALAAIGEPDLWQDNGFGGPERMDASHAPILDCLLTPIPTGVVLDLGCGNGRLLARLAEVARQTEIHGVEVVFERARRGQMRHFDVQITHGSMFDATWEADQYGAVVIMPGRLQEQSAAVAAAMVAKLRVKTSTIVAYAYGDVLARVGGLDAMLEQTGLRQAFPVEVIRKAALGVEAVRLTR